MISNCRVWFLATLLFWTVEGAGQDAKQFIYLDDWSYELIDYWLNNGSLSQRYVLNQPYTLIDIQKGLCTQDRWVNILNKYYEESFGEQGSGKIILYGRDNYSIVSDGDLPKSKVLPQAPFGDVLLFENRNKNHFNFAGQFNLMLPHLSLVNRTALNSELKDDPRFFGDTKEWIFGRTQDAYLNASVGPFDMFVGRTDRNWGTLSAPGLVLSNAPYSYDHAQLSFTSEHFKFSMLLTRLEDMLGRNTEGAYPDSLFESRKFMTAHRFDFSVSENVQFGLTEIAVYGGPDRDFEMGFLNPMNYFYLVQRNNQVDMNGLWAVDVFLKPDEKVNFFLQFLLDDIIVNNEPDVDDRANRPDRLGLHVKLSQADLWLDGLQTGIEYTRIGNRTYQSFRTWENFHHRRKSLGYPVPSTERVALQANYFRLFPAIIKLSAAFQRRGDVDITDAFGGFKDPKFPVGTVEKTLETQIDLRYLLNHRIQFMVKLGYEVFDNYRNVAGDDRTNVKFVFGAQLNWSAKVRLN